MRLESIRIGRMTVTSAEAIQRWVEAREQQRQTRYTAPTPPRIAEVAQERAHKRKVLEEFRAVPTELDRFIRSLSAGGASARERVAGVLFRAGIRTVADLRGKTVEQLLAMNGIGPMSAPVVRALASRCAP